MKKFYCLMTSLMVFISYAFAQNTVAGKVYDNITKEPLAGVIVIIPNSQVGTNTDGGGNFRISSSDVIDSLELRFIGYNTQRFKSDEGKNLNFALSQATINIREVVITASREAQSRSEVPLAISKINATAINDAKPTLITELMNKVPGVVMLNLNNEQHGMGIRQPMGTSNYFLYMEDGIPIRPMGVFNHNGLIEMNIFAISGIEVVKGPASSLYGPEAVGGAINFITQKPTAVLSAKAGIQCDNLGYKRFQYGTGGMITKKVGIYIAGVYAKQQNGWMTNSDYNKNSFNARFDYDLLKNTKLIASGTFNDYYSQTGSSVDSTAFYSKQYVSTTDFTFRKVRSIRTRFTVEQKWNHNNNTTLHLFYRDNSISQNPAYSIKWITGKSTASGQINVSSFSSRGFILQHTASLTTLKTKISAGISADNSPASYNAYQIDLNADLRPGGFSVEKYTVSAKRPEIKLSDYNAVLWNYAAYTQMEIKPFEKFIMTLGGRYDIMSFDYHNLLDNSIGKKSFRQFSPKVGFTYKLTHNTGLYANYARGFAPPGLTSIFIKKPNTPEPEFYYNLSPAQFTNYELGGWVSVLKNKIDIDLSIYDLIGRNELLNIRQPDNSTDYQSAGKTTHQGIEYGITFRPGSEWSFRLSATNSVHRFDEFVLSTKATDPVQNVNGKTMPNAPSWIANCEIVYKPKYVKGLRVGLEWQHMSSWYQDQVNRVKYEDKGAFGLKGISVLNARVGYQWKYIESFCNIMNITDELYANNATRGNSANSRTIYTAAAPRTFVIGLQYNFTGKK